MEEENNKYRSYAEWLKENPPPSLTELVEKFGGYDRVPPLAWREFDAAKAAWELRRKHR